MVQHKQRKKREDNKQITSTSTSNNNNNNSYNYNYNYNYNHDDSSNENKNKRMDRNFVESNIDSTTVLFISNTNLLAYYDTYSTILGQIRDIIESYSGMVAYTNNEKSMG